MINGEFGRSGSLALVESLDLSNNKISRISDDFFSHFPKLRNLNLNMNLLEDISWRLTELQNLEQVCLLGNRVKNLESWVMDLKADVHLEWHLYCTKSCSFSSISSCF